VEGSVTDVEEPEMVTVRLPKAHWNQIVSDIEDMLGTGDHSEIEILSQIEVEED
jgi:hypothetical protein